MAPLEQTALLLVASMGAGLLGSLVGLGGGVILVPVLTLGFHAGIRVAIAASIVAVVASSVAAAPRALSTGFSNVRVGIFLAVATTLGGLTGALVSGIVDPRVLYGLFGGVLVVSAVQMALRGRSSKTEEPAQGSSLAVRLGLRGSYPGAGEVDGTSGGGEVGYTVQRPLLGLSLMYVAGTVSGLLGIGAGVLKVPAMDVAMRLPMKVSTATSSLLIGVTASAGAIVYLVRGSVDPYLAGPVAVGVLAGAWMGGRVFTRMAPSVIRMLFLTVLTVVAAQMLWKAVGG